VKRSGWTAALGVLAIGCASGQGAASGGQHPAGTADRVAAARLTVEFEAPDSAIARDLTAYARAGVARIEDFFGSPFPLDVTLIVLPDREAFDAYAAEHWGMPATECWMVGAAATQSLVLVSPRHWSADCDHDPSDAGHVRDIVVHELVHVYHMQNNPSHEFEGAEEVAWFTEGLATFVSGQLETGHADRAREAVAAGAAPSRLADAWSGPYRYGVAGSLARFFHDVVGHEAFPDLLKATTQAELLAPLGMTEDEVLDAWKEWVRRGSPYRDPRSQRRRGEREQGGVVRGSSLSGHSGFRRERSSRGYVDREK